VREFRAKDADRDRSVELIEAAYVDGQLGDADRELRISRALSAQTLDELETLTRDLQLPAGYVPPAPPNQVVAAPPSRPRRVGGVVAGLGLFIALVVAGVTGFVALLMFAMSSEPEVVTSQGMEPAPTPIASEEPAEVPEAPSFAMTEGQVRTFLRAYEKKFGTLDAWDISFFPDRVAVDVPVRGSRPRFETWQWDGEWEQTSEPYALSGTDTGVVDLGRIGPQRLVANIRTAERTLRVQRGVFTHAVLWPFDAVGPTLNIHVGNTFGESGYLRTTLEGDRIVLRLPYGR
jgi:hypothetical protein